MKWRGRRGSANIEDRRNSGGRRGGGMRRAGGVGGLGAVAIIVVGMLLGVDTSFLLARIIHHGRINWLAAVA